MPSATPPIRQHRGHEFRVNTSTSNTQFDPAVTGLANGGWVVSWTDLYGAAANTYDVFLQQYDAAGRQVDGETLVNSYTPYVQQQPAITSDGRRRLRRGLLVLRVFERPER
jgi:hypothetical protein